jgi:hypothetical protein
VDIKILAAEYVYLKKAIDALKDETKELNRRFDEIRLRLIPEAMEEQGIKNINLDGIGLVYLTADLYTSVPSDKKEDFYEWLEDNGLRDLVTETVNSSTLKAWCKERIESGKQIPPMVEISPFTRASIKQG